MANIIGPISHEVWYTLIQLKGSIRYMKEENPGKFDLAIKKETNLYNNLFGEIFECSN